MSYNWESGAIFELIDMYRDRPLLWDTNREDYRDRGKKNVAWQEIAANFGVDRQVVERKMKILVSQYRRELHQRCLKGEDSRWYAFSRLSFLKVRGELAQQQSESDEEQDKSDVEQASDQSNAKPQKATSPVAGPSTSASTQRPPSRKIEEPKLIGKSRQISDSDEIPRKKKRCSAYSMKKMVKMISKDRKSRDEFVVFGEHVANKLRNIDDPRARNTVQYHINNILYNAEIGKYDDTPKLNVDKDRPRTYQRNQFRIEFEDDRNVTNIAASEGSSNSLLMEIKEESDPVY